jgi:DNA primase
MLEEILGRLDKVKKAGKNYVACCPVHQDNTLQCQSASKALGY